MVSDVQITTVLTGLTVKDLRTQLRARNLSPAGSVDNLKARLREYMQQTGDISMLQSQEQAEADDLDSGFFKNNYARPAGNQNLGNKVTNRPSSRVLAPPGGASKVFFGDYQEPAPAKPPAASTGHAGVDVGDVYHRIGKLGLESDSQAVPPNPNLNHHSVSKLAFGDYRLPSTQDALPERDARASGAQETMSAVEVDTAIRGLMLKDLRTQCRLRGLNPAGSLEALRDRLKDNMFQTGNMSILSEGSAAPAPVAAGGFYAGSSMPDLSSGRLANNYQRPGGQQNVGNFITDRPSSRVLAPPGGVSSISLAHDDSPKTNMPQMQYRSSPAPPTYHVANPYGTPDSIDIMMRQQQLQQPPPPPPAMSAASYYGSYSSPYGASYGSPYGASNMSPAVEPQYERQASIPRAGAQTMGNYGVGAGDSTQYQGGSQNGSSSEDARTGHLRNNYARPGGQQNVGNFITDRPSSRVLAPPGGKSQITFG